jgi:NAD(P)-dependent dehydrogenase (short-subunit alcohol dehydrogenase family)
MTAGESGVVAPREEQRGGVPLQAKVAIVTGAASGLGRASALVLARAGARVVVADLDAQGGRVQAGRAPEPFRFRNVPGPARAAGV